MESYEQKSEEADSQGKRLEDEGERVERKIEEAKSDWQSKQGQVPGMERGDPADPHNVGDEEDEAGDEGEETDGAAAD